MESDILAHENTRKTPGMGGPVPCDTKFRYNVRKFRDRFVYRVEYCGTTGGLPVTGGCPGGRLAGAEFPPILKFLSASETIGFDPSCPAPVGDGLESSEG